MYFKKKEKWQVGNNITFFLLHLFIRDLVVSRSRGNNRDNDNIFMNQILVNV